VIWKSLVHYEISAQIGRGAMGEVYQAKDTKLGWLRKINVVLNWFEELKQWVPVD
jgi:serine/threonine protein kinase